MQLASTPESASNRNKNDMASASSVMYSSICHKSDVDEIFHRHFDDPRLSIISAGKKSDER